MNQFAISNDPLHAQNLAGRPVGPKPSQWAALRNVLRHDGDISKIVPQGNDIEKEPNDWGAPIETGAKNTFADKILALLHDPQQREAVIYLAHHIREWLTQQGWFDE